VCHFVVYCVYFFECHAKTTVLTMFLTRLQTHSIEAMIPVRVFVSGVCFCCFSLLFISILHEKPRYHQSFWVVFSFVLQLACGSLRT
jgi:hypothetical protein